MININEQTIGGHVTKILTGREPLPWMLMHVKAESYVWDRHGKRTKVWTNDAVVIQGHEHVSTYRSLIKEGSYVFAIGGRVPAFAVANEAHLRGAVLLASIFQPQEHVND